MRAVPVTWLLLTVCGLSEMTPQRHPLVSSGNCGEGQYSCANDRCIIDRWRCDGDDDCGDGSDEDPVICGLQTCRTGQFQCQNTTATATLQCIPASWRCDGAFDCSDRSDEQGCSSSCTPEHFTCGNGNCINQRWVCDGDNDCEDGSDEQNCAKPTCNSASHFTCSSGECVPATSRCDRDQDCADNSDELGCPEPADGAATCRPGEVPCGSGSFSCIFHAWQCDGQHDCPDGSDEDPSRCGPRPACRPDQFQCGELRECIARRHVCSGTTECSDGSDEANCDVCDPEEHLRCANGTCLNITLACNGVDDCGDGSDEGSNCSSCAQGNGGCSHSCQDLPTGRRCSCQPGYQLAQDGATCEDIDECKTPGACSHICINQVGHFKCECHPGYLRDPSDHTYCKAQGVRPSLLLTHRTDIRRVSLDHQEMTAVVNETRMVTAVDYDFRSGLVYWSDAADRAIYSSPIDESSRRLVVRSGVQPQDLAVDWLYGRLYWTCAEKEHRGVLVTALDGDFQLTLVQTEEVAEPRAIVLDPVTRWMYWSDWGAEAKIERAGMDGSHRRTIVDTEIAWPNGLTLDLELRRIFWVDTRRRVLESADLDGGNRQIVINSFETLHHPYSLTTFEDKVYWSDLNRTHVFSANKFTGERVESVAPLSFRQHFVSDVQIYHPYRQPDGTNFCQPENGGCSHVCLPAPAASGGRQTSCACPAGLLLSEDGRTCTESAADEVDVAPPPASADHQTMLSPSESGSMTAIVVTAVVLVIVATALAGVMLYRRGAVKGFSRLQFDSPSYKKSFREVVTLQKTRRPTYPVSVADNEALIASGDQREAA